jgi:hypothetical protein
MADIPESVRRTLINELGREAVAASEAANEMRRFASETKSLSAKHKHFGENLVASGIPLIKFTGTMVKAMSSYNEAINNAKKQQETNTTKLTALEATLLNDQRKFYEARTASEGKTAALRMQATVDQIASTKLSIEENGRVITSMKSAKLSEAVQQTAKSMKDTGQALMKFTASLNKTQQDFGITMGGAATLKANVLMDTVKDTADILSKIDYSAAANAVTDIFGGIFSGVKELVTGGGITATTKAMMAGLEKANQPIPGEPLDQMLLPSERLAGIKSLQKQFGVINRTLGSDLAQTAKNYGVNVEELTQSLRTFSTIAQGNLSRVEQIQTRFIDIFDQRGMSPQVALEAISKYSELIVRNGNRFADSFARAAADAKKIGVDLGKIDQFGDSIITDFEGFLEKSAELGAMGFDLDATRLAQIAETGSTADLYNELRSQLALTGKDLTNLRRSERLGLENLGLPMSDILRMAGGTPEIKKEDLAKDNNTKLTQLLILAQISGPLLGPLSSMAAALGPAGAIALAIGILTTWAINKWGSADEKAKFKEDEARKLLDAGKFDEGKRLLEEAKSLQTPYFVGRLRMIPLLEQKMDVILAQYKPRTPSAQQIFSPESLAPYDLNRQLTPGNTFSPFTPSLQKASGGPVNGPGTGTSDSIPARLSNGEFVVKADSAKKVGTTFLNSLNMTGTVPTKKPEEQDSVFGKSKDTVSNLGKVTSAGTPFIQNLAYLKQAPSAVGLGGSLAFERFLTLNPNPAATWMTADVLRGNALNALKKQFRPEYLKKINQSSVLGALPGVAKTGVKELKWFDNGLVQPIKKAREITKQYGKFAGASELASGILKKVGSIFLVVDTMQKIGTGDNLGAVENITKVLAGKAAAVATTIGATGSTYGVGLATGAAPMLGVGADIGTQHLVGMAFDKIRERNKMNRYDSGKIVGKKPDVNTIVPPIDNLMQSLPMLSGIARQSQEMPTSLQAPISVDTTGIERQLNNFINALQGIQVHMDGAKVGKMLVNSNDAATAVGVFGAQYR